MARYSRELEAARLSQVVPGPGYVFTLRGALTCRLLPEISMDSAKKPVPNARKQDRTLFEPRLEGWANQSDGVRSWTCPTSLTDLSD